MAVSEAKKRCNAKWNAENYHRTGVSIPKTLWAEAEPMLKEDNLSLNGFINTKLQEYVLQKNKSEEA